MYGILLKCWFSHLQSQVLQIHFKIQSLYFLFINHQFSTICWALYEDTLSMVRFWPRGLQMFQHWLAFSPPPSLPPCSLYSSLYSFNKTTTFLFSGSPQPDALISSIANCVADPGFWNEGALLPLQISFSQMTNSLPIQGTSLD